MDEAIEAAACRKEARKGLLAEPDWAFLRWWSSARGNGRLPLGRYEHRGGEWVHAPDADWPVEWAGPELPKRGREGDRWFVTASEVSA